MKKTIVAILIALTMLLAGCNQSKVQENIDEGSEKTGKQTAFKGYFLDTFDTKIDLTIFADNQETYDKWFALAKEEFTRLHRLYDNYHSYEGINNIYTINAMAGVEPVVVDKSLVDLILFAKEWQNTSKGKMDVSIGPVLEIWHDYREEGMEHPEEAEVPPMEALKRANALKGIDKIVVDEEKHTVFLEEKGMRIDLGAVAKGYATERVRDLLVKNGVSAGIIGAGGNVRTIGQPLDDGRQRWGIGIQNPDLEANENFSETLYIKEGSVVTSGDYQRNYQVDGKVYHHLIDPDTLMPAVYFRSVSVYTQDSGIADALSTTLFLMAIDEGKAYLSTFEGVEALWVTSDGTVAYTEGMAPFMASQGANTNQP